MCKICKSNDDEKCNTCYSHTCPVCKHPIYRDESWMRSADGLMKHIRCRAGVAVPRPEYMSKTKTD